MGSCSIKGKYCSEEHVQRCMCALDNDVKCFSCVGAVQSFRITGIRKWPLGASWRE